MAEISGGNFYDPWFKRIVSWKPVEEVKDEYRFASTHAGYQIAGVIGNFSHWFKVAAGDHTSRSTHYTVVSGKRFNPKAGWIYAIDLHVPDPAKFENWLLGQVRAGKRNIKYFNINGHHWNRMNSNFGYAVGSSDQHLHLSFMPNTEAASSSILADYNAYRTGAKPVDSGDGFMAALTDKQQQDMAFSILSHLEPFLKVMRDAGFDSGKFAAGDLLYTLGVNATHSPTYKGPAPINKRLDALEVAVDKIGKVLGEINAKLPAAGPAK